MRPVERDSKKILILLFLLFMSFFSWLIYQQGHEFLEEVNTRLKDHLSERMEGTIEWEGMHIFPINRIVLSGVRLKTNDGLPLFHGERVVIRYNPLYLFRGAMGFVEGIGQAQVYSPTLNLIERGGVFNIEGFILSGGEFLTALQGKLSLHDGEIVMESEEYGHLKLGNIQGLIDFSTGLVYGMDIRGHLFLEDQVSLHLLAKVQDGFLDISFSFEDLNLSSLDPSLTGETDMSLSFLGYPYQGEMQGQLQLAKGAFSFQGIEFQETEGWLRFSRDHLDLQSLSMGLSHSFSSLTKIQGLSLELDVRGEASYEEGITPYHFKGHLLEESISLFFTGTNLPLSQLTPYFEGDFDLDLKEGDLVLEVSGGKSSLEIQGDIFFQGGEVYQEDEHLRVQEIGGRASFLLEDLVLYHFFPLSYEASPLSLELDLYGLLEGSPLTLQGIVQGDTYKLSFKAREVSLPLFSFFLEEDWDLRRGQGDLNLTLTKEASLEAKGSLYVRGVDISSLEHSFHLVQGEGQLSFFHKGPFQVEEDLFSLVERLELATDLKGELNGSKASLKGHVREEDIQLTFTSQGFSFRDFSHLIPSEWEGFYGEGDLKLQMKGPIHGLYLSGELHLHDGGFDIDQRQKVSHLGGEILFSLDRPLSRDTLSNLFDPSYLNLDASVKANLSWDDFSSPLSLRGELEREFLNLYFEGEALPLSLLEDFIELPVEDTGGLSQVSLHIFGMLDSFYLSGQVGLTEARFTWDKDKRFSHLEGHLSFEMIRPLCLDLLTSPLDPNYLQVQGSLQTLFSGKDFSSPLSLHGSYSQGLIYLNLSFKDLCLPFLTNHFDLPMEEVEGLLKGRVNLMGPVENFLVSGNIHLSKGGFTLVEEHLTLSQLEGYLSFAFLEPLGDIPTVDAIPLKALNLKGDVRGEILKEGLISPFSLKGERDRGTIHLFVEGEDLPLYLLSRYSFAPLPIHSGVGDVKLQALGKEDDLKLQGHLVLKEGGFQLLPLEASILHTHAHLSFLITGFPSPKTWHLFGHLKASLYRDGQLTPFSLQGSVTQEDLLVTIAGEGIPLNHFSRELNPLGLTSLEGMGDLEVYLKGPLERYQISLSLSLEEGGFFLAQENLQLSLLEGNLTFQIPSLTQLSLVDLHLEGDVQGQYQFEGEGGFFSLEGGLAHGSYELEFFGQDLPLAYLNHFDLVWGLESIGGLLDLEIQVTGQDERFEGSGELHFKDGSLSLTQEDLIFTSLEGGLAFQIPPLTLLELEHLSFRDLDLEGTIEGQYGLEGEGGFFSLKGRLAHGTYELDLLGEDLPLQYLNTFELVWGLESINGFGDLHLQVTGQEEGFEGFGHFLVTEGSLSLPQEDLTFSSLEGGLAFQIPPLTLLELEHLSFRDLDLEGTIEGQYGLEGEGGFFSLKGRLAHGTYELDLLGEDLPLQYLNTFELVWGLESIGGLGDLHLQVTGQEEGFEGFGHLFVTEGSLSLPQEDLTFSSLEGSLTFHLPSQTLEHLSLRDLDLEGTIEGQYGLEGEGGFFSLKGRLAHGIYELDLLGEDLPLQYLNTFELVGGFESIGGLGDLHLLVIGQDEIFESFGHLLVKEGSLSLPQEDLTFSSLEGALTFHLPFKALEHLSLRDLDLEGTIEGQYGLEGEGGFFSLNGSLAHSSYELEFYGEDLPLQYLNTFELVWGLESIGGFGDVHLQVTGQGESLGGIGHLLVKKGGLSLPQEDLIFTALEGELTFHLPYQALEHLTFEDLHLQGTLEGQYLLEGEGGYFSLEGSLVSGSYVLDLLGENLPVQYFNSFELVEGLKSIGGLGDVHLQVTGHGERFGGEGHLLLKEGSLSLAQEDLMFSSVEGELTFKLPSLSFQAKGDFSLEDLILQGTLEGQYLLEGEGGYFSLEGSLASLSYVLDLLGENLPFHYLNSFDLVEGLESIGGFGDLHLQVQGHGERFGGEGHLLLKEGSLSLAQEDLIFSSVEGELTFKLPSLFSQAKGDFSLEDLILQGTLEGQYLLEGEGGYFSLGGSLASGIYELDLFGMHLPLQYVNSFQLPEGLESMAGLLDLHLMITGHGERFEGFGHLHFKEGSLSLTQEDRILSSLEGELTLKLPPLSFQDLDHLSLEDLILEGDVKGKYLLEGEEGLFSLAGRLTRGYYELEIWGQEVPLKYLNAFSILPDEVSLGGYSTIEMDLTGSLEELEVSGQMELLGVFGDLSSYGFTLFGVEGYLSFAFLESLNLSQGDLRLNLEDILLTCSLAGGMEYEGQEGGLFLWGDLQKGYLDMNLVSFRFPLSLFPKEGLSGFMDLAGYGAGTFTLNGPLDALMIAGELDLKEATAIISSYQVQLSSLEGTLTFSLEDLSFFHPTFDSLTDYSLKGSLTGCLHYQEDSSTFSLAGDVDPGSFELEVQGHFLPLSFLSLEFYPEGLPFGGYGNVDLKLSGTKEAITFAGDVSLKEAWVKVQDDLSFSSLSLDFQVSKEEPVLMEDLLSLKPSFETFMDYGLKGSLTGYLHYEEDWSTFSLVGDLDPERIELEVQGHLLPLSLFWKEFYPEGLPFGGYGNVDLKLSGTKEAITFAGDVSLKEAWVKVQDDLSFSSLSLDFQVSKEEPVSMEHLLSLKPSFETFMDYGLKGSLTGYLHYEEDWSTFSLAGDLASEMVQLEIWGQSLPLSLFSKEFYPGDLPFGGYGDVDLKLSGTKEAITFAGDVSLKEAWVKVQDDLSFSSLSLDFQVSKEEPVSMEHLLSLKPSLETFMDYGLKGSLTGYLHYEGDWSSFSLAGDVDSEMFQFDLEGDSLPLSLFSKEFFPKGLPFGGYGDVDLELSGTPEYIIFAGDVLLQEVWVLVKDDLSFSSLSGHLHVSREEPVLMEDLLSLKPSFETFMDYGLKGSLTGYLHYEEDRSSFSLAGDLASTIIELEMVGDSLPLSLFSKEFFPKGLPFHGYSDVDLKLSGLPESLTLSGDVSLKEVWVRVQDDLSFQSVKGHLQFLMEDLLSFDSFPLSFLEEERLEILGNLSGMYKLRHHQGGFSLEGELCQDRLDLIMTGESLPLSFLSQELPFQITSLEGYSDVQLEVFGELEAMNMRGLLLLEEAGFQLPAYNLSFSHLAGEVSFALDQSLDLSFSLPQLTLEDLSLSMDLEGMMSRNEESAFFSLEGSLYQEEFQLFFTGLDFPLTAISSYLPEEYQLLGGRGSITLSLAGNEDLFSLTGQIELAHVFLNIPQYRVSLSQGQGYGSLVQNEVRLEHLLEDLLASAFDFKLEGLAHPQEGGSSPFFLKGSIQEEEVSLQVQGEDLPLAFLYKEGERMTGLESPVEILTGVGDLFLSVTMAKELEVEGNLALKETSLYFKKEDLLFEGVFGRLSFSKDEVLLEEIKGVLAGMELDLSGKVRHFNHLDFGISFQGLNLSLLEDYFPIPSLSGLAKGKVTLFGEIKDPLLYGNVEMADVNLEGYYLQEACFSLRYRQGQLTVMDLAASLKEGTLTGYGILDVNQELPVYSLSLDLQGISLHDHENFPDFLGGFLSGHLFLSGTGWELERLNILGSGNIYQGSIQEYDFLQLYSSFWFHQGILFLSHLKLSMEEGILTGEGTIDGQGGLALNLRSDSFYLGEFQDNDVQGALKGSISGTFNDPLFAGLVTLKLTNWGDLNLKVMATPEKIHIKEGNIQRLGEDLSLQGTYYFQEESLDFSLTFQELPLEELSLFFPSQSIPHLTGKGQGEILLEGSLSRPALEGEISFHQASFLGQGLEEFRFKIIRGGDYFFIDECYLLLTGGRVDLYGEASMAGDLTLNLNGRTFPLQDLLYLFPEQPMVLQELEGDLDFNLRLTGSIEEWEMDGSIRGQSLAWRGLSFEMARGDFTYGKERLEIPKVFLYRGGDEASLSGIIDFQRETLEVKGSLERVGLDSLLYLLDLENDKDSQLNAKGHLLLEGPFSKPTLFCDLAITTQDLRGEFYLQGDFYPEREDVHLFLRSNDFPMQEITPFLFPEFPLEGELSFSGELKGPLYAPNLYTEDFSLKEGNFGGYRIESMEGLVHLKDGENLYLKQAIHIGETQIELHGHCLLQDFELDLHLLVEEGHLDSVAWFFPQVLDAQGRFSLDLSLGGTLSHPLAWGEMDLIGASFSFDYPHLSPVRGLDGSIIFNHYHVHIPGIVGYYGDGPFKIHGEMGVSGLEIIYLSLHLNGERIPFMYQGIEAYLFPALRLEGSLRHPLVTGRIGLEDALIPLPLDAPTDLLKMEDLPVVDVFLYPRKNVRITNGRMRFFIQRGELRVENFTGEFLLLGEIFSEQGSMYILNNQFHLEEGKATFTRFYPNNPRIVARAANYFTAERQIYLHIDGQASDLRFSFSAENGMNQEEIIQALAGTGDLRIMEGDYQDLTGDLWRFIAQSLRLDFLTQIEEALARTFDLDDVFLLQDMEANIQLRVGKFVIDDLYLTYRRTLTGTVDQQMGFEYRLNPYTRIGGDLYQDGEFRLMLKGSWPF